MPDLETYPQWLGFLVTRGLVGTIQLAVIVSILSILFAGALALARISPVRTLRVLARVDVDLFRSIPLLALLIFLYFGIGPAVAKYGITAFMLSVVALTLTESAYIAEVYRGALEAVPPSQWEAARSLGLGWRRLVRYVVLPQAILPSIPATVNLLIAILKDSALASLIAVTELTLSATILTSLTFKPMEVWLMVAGIYLVLIVPLSLFARYTEQAVEQRVGLRMRAAALVAAPDLTLPPPADLEPVRDEVRER